MSIYGNAVRKPITTLMIFVAVIVLGVYSLSRLPIDLYPEIELPAISVLTSYTGANALDIETNITKPIEDALNSVSNLKELTSRSIDNASVVILEFEFGSNLDEAANDIRNSLSFIENYLPEGSEKPVVFKFNSSMMPIIFYSITAEESYPGLSKILDERLVNPLNRIDGIGSIGLSGLPQRQVTVEVDPLKLQAYNLTIEQIGQIIQAENMNMPSGNVKMGMNDYALRIEGEFKESDEIDDIIVSNVNGEAIFIKDIATVRDTIKEMTLDEKINGKLGVNMFIMKQSGANTVKVAQEVRDELELLKENLPPDIEIQTIFDSSDFINDSVDNLSITLLWALIFVVIVVLFFLGRWRATFIVVITIPISLLVSFIYLQITGSSINIISLSSLAIAIGMVVDDAIVVLENIAKHIDRGSTPREAAIYATNEVWMAVIITTLTVVAVFLPLTFIKGMTGALFRQLGWIVSITVITSTVTAISLTPVLASKLMKLKLKKKRIRAFSYSNTILRFLNGMDKFYVRSLKWALRHKLMVGLLTFGIFILSLFLIAMVGAEFIPQTDESHMSAVIELQTGTRVEITSEIARSIEKKIQSQFPEVVMVSTSSGSEEEGGFLAIFSETGSNVMNMRMSLKPINERERDVWTLAEEFRIILDSIPEIVKYNIITSGGMGTGTENVVSVDIYGYDIKRTNALATEFTEKIKDIPGARNIQITREDEKPELQVILNQEKMSQHLINTAIVSTALRNRIQGFTCTRFREMGDEYNVVVKLKEEYRNSISDVENIMLQNPLGQLVKLKDIGTVVEYWAPPNIEHKRKERIVSVQVTPYRTSLKELADKIKILKEGMDIPPEILVEIGGAYEDMMETMTDLFLLMIVSLILVYIVMAAQFESFKMPLFIMFSIPFSFTGVFIGLFITGKPLSVIAFLGAVLLIGIVVKNAIVLVDYINLMRERGYEVNEAIIISGESRLRPVLMTAFTTIMGMLPMAISTREGSEIWNPMGIAVISGLIFSTLITMILVPVVYSFFMRRSERRKLKKVRAQYHFMDEIDCPED